MSFFVVENGKWDIGKLDEFFILDDNEAIQNIPLARGLCVDDLF